MFKQLITWFSKNHLLVNFIVIIVLVGGIFAWQKTSKEELPNIEMDFLRVNANWSGASPEDMERYVTDLLEEEITGIEGIDSITSTTSSGSCTIMINLTPKNRDRDKVITEIKDAVSSAKMPSDMKNDPSVREFKTSRKTVMNIALHHKDQKILNKEGREEVQKMVRALENSLNALPSVNEINRTGYLATEVNVYLNPKKLIEYNISISEVLSAIRSESVRQPTGTIEAAWITEEGGNLKKDNSLVAKKPKEPNDSTRKATEPIQKIEKFKAMRNGGPRDIKVTLDAELNTVEELSEINIRTSFEGYAVKLKDLAEVKRTFTKESSIVKMNGFQSVSLRITKNVNVGIIKTVDEIKEKLVLFERSQLKNSNVSLLITDDESLGIRARLALIASNGLLGFTLILLILFAFLNFKSGFWVAMGIPFSFCFTLIFVYFMGYSINNITLAAVIIVMGMVVDDAIVVAENIARLEQAGVPVKEAVVEGTSTVFLPVLASVVTTMIAFVPLFFLSGRMGLMNSFIPPIIILMLIASLIESLFILPAHMATQMPRLFQKEEKEKEGRKWFTQIEQGYTRVLNVLLRHKLAMLLGVLFLVAFSFFRVTKMKYEMFPREQSTTMYLTGNAPHGTAKLETAKAVEQIEEILKKSMGKEVDAFQSTIGMGRFGSAAKENQFTINISLTDPNKREMTGTELEALWQSTMSNLPGIERIQFAASRWGSTSGSPIEILVKENDDDKRKSLVAEISNAMGNYAAYKNIEIERDIRDPEYKLIIDREAMGRLKLSTAEVASTMRTIINGTLLYLVPEDGEDVGFTVTVDPKDKNSIEKILDIPIKNGARYMVPLKNSVSIEKGESPNTVTRTDGKRTSKLYAEMNKEKKLTPLETAEHFEKEVFPALLAKYPTASIEYAGEVKTTRESGGELKNSAIVVVLIIYLILTLLFNSLTRPLLIILTIPFGLVGVILALSAHGVSTYGFYTIVGTLGLAGVVVNDSIVMLEKLEREIRFKKWGKTIGERVQNIATTRLRAVMLTTLTTVAGLFPTAYGILGYDSMLSDMMLALAWGLIFGTLITLFFIPVLYSIVMQFKMWKGDDVLGESNFDNDSANNADDSLKTSPISTKEC